LKVVANLSFAFLLSQTLQPEGTQGKPCASKKFKVHYYAKKRHFSQAANDLEVPQFFGGWRGIPEPSAVHALAARKKKSPLLDDLRYNAKC